jgi:hypothetical protein
MADKEDVSVQAMGVMVDAVNEVVDIADATSSRRRLSVPESGRISWRYGKASGQIYGVTRSDAGVIH